MKSQSPQMQVLLLNGRVLHFTSRELQDLMGSRRLLRFVLLMWMAIIVVNPYFFSTIPSFASRGFYWGTMMLVYVLVLARYVSFICRTWARLSKAPIPHPLVSLPLLIGLTGLATSLPTIFGEWVPPRNGGFGVFICFRNWAITVVLECMGLYFFWPKGTALVNQHDTVNETTTAAATIAGVIIPIKSIIRVNSAGHYLQVQTATGEKEYRARMKDLLVQVSEADGMSPHRSYWIARSQISEIRRNTIFTTSGENLPVARGQIDKVRAWGMKYLTADEPSAK